LGTFWLKIEQFWPFEEISIFSNSGHLGYRTALTDTNLKGTHPGTIPARFGLIWFSSFRGEDLNVIFYQNMPNLHNRYVAAVKISAHFVPPFFYFELGGHLGWKSGSPDTILKGGHPRTIPPKFGCNWSSGF
jgi:hypothetical protein